MPCATEHEHQRHRRRLFHRRRDVWVWVGGPVPPGSAAITLGRLIIVRRAAADDERLMRHELVHVRQWRELGVVGFLVQYLGAYFRGRWDGLGHREAYRRIPLEVQAEREAGWGTSLDAAEAGSSATTAPAVTDVPPLESEPPATTAPGVTGIPPLESVSATTAAPAVTDVPPLDLEPPAG